MSANTVKFIAPMVILVVAALLFWRDSGTPMTVDVENRFDGEQKAFWEERIRVMGGATAYREFVRTAQDARFTDGQRHILAHTFGSALYAAEGMRGIGSCGSDFSFGCFHELIGEAIAERGVGAVSGLNQTCIELFGDDVLLCQHGIGHGIQASFGYNTHEDLVQALQTCATLEQGGAIAGCRGGVFMEYNFRTMLADEAAVREDDDPFGLCRGLSGDDLLACSYWIQEWWMGDDALTEQQVANAGALCTEMTAELALDHALLRACFSGIGNTIAGRVPSDINRARQLCAAASEDRAYVAHCLSQVEANAADRE